MSLSAIGPVYMLDNPTWVANIFLEEKCPDNFVLTYTS